MRADVIQVRQEHVEAGRAEHELPGGRRSGPVRPLEPIRRDFLELHRRVAQVFPQGHRQGGLIEEAQVQAGRTGERVRIPLAMKRVVADDLGHDVPALRCDQVQWDDLGRVDVTPTQPRPSPRRRHAHRSRHDRYNRHDVPDHHTPADQDPAHGRLRRCEATIDGAVGSGHSVPAPSRSPFITLHRSDSRAGFLTTCATRLPARAALLIPKVRAGRRRRLFPGPHVGIVAEHLAEDPLLLVQRDEQEQREAEGQHDRPPGRGMVQAHAAHLVEDVQHERGEPKP